jgi:hypothetical protein
MRKFARYAQREGRYFTHRGNIKLHSTTAIKQTLLDRVPPRVARSAIYNEAPGSVGRLPGLDFRPTPRKG